MSTTFESVEAETLAHISAGADPDDLASALLQQGAALVLAVFGHERAATLMRNLADALEATSDGR